MAAINLRHFRRMGTGNNYLKTIFFLNFFHKIVAASNSNKKRVLLEKWKCRVHTSIDGIFHHQVYTCNREYYAKMWLKLIVRTNDKEFDMSNIAINVVILNFSKTI